MTTENKVIIGVVIVTAVVLGGGIWLLSSQGAKEQAKLSKSLIGEAIEDRGPGKAPL